MADTHSIYSNKTCIQQKRLLNTTELMNTKGPEYKFMLKKFIKENEKAIIHNKVQTKSDYILSRHIYNILKINIHIHKYK